VETTEVAKVLQGLLAACRADPDDDAVRLVLADWLEEQGDPRGELVRIQVERARVQGLAPEREAALTRREADLLRRHGADWLGPLAGQCDDQMLHRGFLSVTINPKGFGPPPAGVDPVWAWVDSVAVPEQRWMAGVVTADTRFRGVSRFQFTEPREQTCVGLAQAPAADRLTSLEIGRGACDTAGFLALLTSPHLSRLRHLTLESTGITSDGLDPLGTLDHPALETLCLFGPDLGAAGGQILSRSPLLGRLRRLELIVTRLGTEGSLALFRSPHLARLEHLHVSSERLTVGGIRALARLPCLRSLALRECQLGLPGARALAAAEWPAGLQGLDLFRNYLDNEAVATLVASPHFQGLRELNLGHNHLGPAGAAHLAQSPLTDLLKLDLSSNGLMNAEASWALVPWLARQRLLSLNLGHNYMEPQGVRLLAECPGLDTLIDLDLTGVHLGQLDEAKVLAAASWLDGVVRLNLCSTHIGPDGLQALLAGGRLGHLTDLDLSGCRLDDQGVQLLAEWPGLAGLSRLRLRGNQIGYLGMMALARSPYLSPALWLDLGGNLFSEAARSHLQLFAAQLDSWRQDG
jgi:uncharacterized protein (TIGR02996 family)